MHEILCTINSLHNCYHNMINYNDKPFYVYIPKGHKTNDIYTLIHDYYNIHDTIYSEYDVYDDGRTLMVSFTVVSTEVDSPW